jgi:phosphate-selective porin OprO/OprP
MSCTGVLCHSVAEASEELLELIEVLRQNGSISDAQYERLQDEALASPPQDTQAAPEETGEQGFKTSTDGGLRVESNDGAYQFRLNGRVLVDGAVYDDDETELGDGTEFRRARISIRGKIRDVWQYRLQYDVTDSAADGIRDAYIRYTGFEPVEITLGQFKEFFSLEELTSSNDTTFMERALPNAFSPGRSLGIGATTNGDNWSFGAGLFSEGPDSNEDEETDEGWGLSARGTFAPIFTETQLVHVGGSFAYREPDDNGELGFSARPESHITNERLVDTGTLEGVDDFYQMGFETAAVFGPFSAQAEYIYTDVSSDEDADFDGWYLYGSYVLTGESRPYAPEDGTFDIIEPNNPLGAGGIGAWEVGLRYSQLALNDGDIEGGREDNITLGLNWYVNDNIRFMLNYIYADVEGGINGDEDFNIYQARAQVTW